MKDAMKKSDDAGVAAAPIRIVVADDHPVVRFGVKNMLENEPGFEVVGEAEDGDVAITQTLELEPDILLLDLAMPRLPGLEALRAIPSRPSRSSKPCRLAPAASCSRTQLPATCRSPCAPCSPATTGSAASVSRTW